MDLWKRGESQSSFPVDNSSFNLRTRFMHGLSTELKPMGPQACPHEPIEKILFFFAQIKRDKECVAPSFNQECDMGPGFIRQLSNRFDI